MKEGYGVSEVLGCLGVGKLLVWQGWLVPVPDWPGGKLYYRLSVPQEIRSRCVIMLLTSSGSSGQLHLIVTFYFRWASDDLL